MTDEEILQYIDKDERYAMDTLLDRYKGFVKIKARSYFLVGADFDDIIQEGMIGLYKAIRDYKAERNNTFKTFAAICIDRQLITAVKAATRNKHKFLNEYISLNNLNTEGENEDLGIIDIMIKEETEPEKLLMVKENIKNIESKIQKNLSKLEKETLYMYLKGMKYTDIATELNTTQKSVDNAIQRIKKKLAKTLL